MENTFLLLPLCHPLITERRRNRENANLLKQIIVYVLALLFFIVQFFLAVCFTSPIISFSQFVPSHRIQPIVGVVKVQISSAKRNFLPTKVVFCHFSIAFSSPIKILFRFTFTSICSCAIHKSD